MAADWLEAETLALLCVAASNPCTASLCRSKSSSSIEGAPSSSICCISKLGWDRRILVGVIVVMFPSGERSGVGLKRLGCVFWMLRSDLGCDGGVFRVGVGTGSGTGTGTGVFSLSSPSASCKLFRPEKMSTPLLFLAVPLMPLFLGDDDRGGLAGVVRVDLRAESVCIGIIPGRG